MTFQNIRASYLLLGVLGFLIFYILAHHKDKKAMERLAAVELRAGLLSSFDMKRRMIKVILALTALTLMIVALMRPQWGFYWREGRLSGLDILIAVDVSRSMLTEDVKPNRLDLAKEAVRGFVRQLRADRVGLIAFSGQSFLACPLTVDYAGFILSLEDLGTDTVPRGGTSLSSAIQEALTDEERKGIKNRTLILLTDGEDHEGDALRLAEKAHREGLRIFCAGIGTVEGGPIPIHSADNAKEFLKDETGRVITSALNEGLLKKIALNAGGSYIREKGGESGLKRVYETHLSSLEKSEFEGRMKKEYKQWFQIPLAMAFFLLMLEPFITERKKDI
jgi:Ca-activated chloride channel family protein